ncbi:hypothetical protein K438DRAFT_1069808 [Mycena galopus ATCC 62051]|nr:hypothetical protein K438DRAFT_1069808 [Mycena galopus ATCC 62051]
MLLVDVIIFFKSILALSHCWNAPNCNHHKLCVTHLRKCAAVACQCRGSACQCASVPRQRRSRCAAMRVTSTALQCLGIPWT